METSNRTAQEFSEVVVWFGEARCSSGYLVPNAQKIYMFYPNPITLQARLDWKDEAGKKHSAEVDLRAVYKPEQSGVLQIAITDGGVEAQMLPLPTLSQ